MVIIGQGPSRGSFGATNLIKKRSKLIIISLSSFILSLLAYIGAGKEIQKAGAQYYGAS